MRPRRRLRLPANPYIRDSKQPVDEAYTKKIKEYTTAPYFSSPLVDYLPASKTVPTPMAVLKDVAGAPGILPYSSEVYQYMRMVEKASPRVKVFSIGKTEEGREMIAVAVSSEATSRSSTRTARSLAKLADPRTINLDDAEADDSSRRPRRSTTSPAPSIRRRPARRPR